MSAAASHRPSTATVVGAKEASMERNWDATLAAHLDLALTPRSGKPRQSGLTMSMDQGWPLGFVDDMLSDFGPFLDIAKPEVQVVARIADKARERASDRQALERSTGEEHARGGASTGEDGR